MAKQKSKDDIKKHIKASLEELNNLCMEIVDSNDPLKADKLAYWLSDYARLLAKEDKVKNFASYKRGSIIKVSLGFNIGSEQGGLHYCVVLKDSSKFDKVVQVIPLSSYKPQKRKKENLRKGEVFLGNELFVNLMIKLDVLIKLAYILKKQIDDRISESKARIEELQNLIPKLDNDKFEIMLSEINNNIEKCYTENNQIQNQIELAKKVKNEIFKMKQGSIALVDQITTVSKLRIYDPVSEKDALNGIRLSNESLNNIDNKIKELYTKS